MKLKRGMMYRVSEPERPLPLEDDMILRFVGGRGNPCTWGWIEGVDPKYDHIISMLLKTWDISVGSEIRLLSIHLGWCSKPGGKWIKRPYQLVGSPGFGPFTVSFILLN